MRTRIAAALCLSFLLQFVPALSLQAEELPLQTRNQSPLVRIFGLPTPGSPSLLPAGATEFLVTTDTANNFAGGMTRHESILLDGESYRTVLSLRHRLAGSLEGGIELPVQVDSGGFLDGFVEGWHSFFGLPQGGREQAPHNRLLYQYQRDGRNLLKIDQTAAGIGDMSLLLGTPLVEGKNGEAALRLSLKLPTGDPTTLAGSGSTDLALWVVGSRDLPWRLSVFGSAGVMGMTRGDVLASMQRHEAFFGSAGIGWRAAERVTFKLQADGHTAFYSGSSLPELGEAIQLQMGGTIKLPAATLLDLAVSEDVMVDASPDVVFHLALRHNF